MPEVGLSLFSKKVKLLLTPYHQTKEKHQWVEISKLYGNVHCLNEVLTVVIMESTVFINVTLCSPIQVH